MKILFYRYGSICEPDILATFEEFGFSVTQITVEITNKDFTPQEGVALLSKTLMDEPHECVFSINFYPFLAEVCNILKIRYLCWVVDSPVMELYSSAIRQPWNRIFLFDRKLFEEIAPLNPGHVFYLPLAVNVAQKQEVITAAGTSGAKRYACDISFLGSLYTEKNPCQNFHPTDERLAGYIDGLAAAQLKVYGYYFIDDILTEETVRRFKEQTRDFLSLPYADARTDRVLVSQYYIAAKITTMERARILASLSERFSVDLYTGSDTSGLPHIRPRGFAKTKTEMPLIFHGSRINLNMTTKSIRSGLPLRIWDILGCGGFCLTNRQPEIPEYFEIGEEIETYADEAELSEKCAWYLEHETRRAEIAAAGLEKVQKYHTYPIRMAEMFEMAFNMAG